MKMDILTPALDLPNYTTSEITRLSSKPSSLINAQLIQIFEDELKNLYWSEKVIAKSISKMIQLASAHVLIEVLHIHLEEKKEHIKRVENAFKIIEKDPAEKKCISMTYLIEEAEIIMAACNEGILCDEAIISAGQKVEQYEIGIYGTLHRFAENLGLKDVASILEKTLNEEIARDKKLAEIAASFNIAI